MILEKLSIKEEPLPHPDHPGYPDHLDHLDHLDHPDHPDHCDHRDHRDHPDHPDHQALCASKVFSIARSPSHWPLCLDHGKVAANIKMKMKSMFFDVVDVDEDDEVDGLDYLGR